jgi:hypothetical protein
MKFLAARVGSNNRFVKLMKKFSKGLSVVFGTKDEYTGTGVIGLSFERGEGVQLLNRSEQN